MSSKVEKLALELLGLPASARAELARRLITSLDETDDGDVDALWIEEAERRLSELREGKVQTVPAEQVLGEIRGKLEYSS